ncbi:hypothetical protein C8R45DRAFT_1087580 [Mycena sanguinolenta]|nr:hypothetical protein C8R45DRAFT_1087580 [Mycena sanguinolenta]
MNSALPKFRCTDEFSSRNEHIALAHAWWRDLRGEERRTGEECGAVRGEVGFPRECEERSGDARLESRWRETQTLTRGGEACLICTSSSYFRLSVGCIYPLSPIQLRSHSPRVHISFSSFAPALLHPLLSIRAFQETLSLFTPRAIAFAFD